MFKQKTVNDIKQHQIRLDANKRLKDIITVAATAGLSLAMLLGSHLISRRFDLGLLGTGNSPRDPWNG